jgi:hypothetical protein
LTAKNFNGPDNVGVNFSIQLEVDPIIFRK